MNKTIRNSVIAGMLALTIMTTAAPAPRAHAATNTDLQAQIAALLATIAQLQAQISGTTTTGTYPTISLTRNLSQGMTGDDVRALQQFLNADPDTQIAVSGTGAKGNETTYFGPMTKAAVIKFQNKYRTQVLTPSGLTNGTGYVGPSTRAHIATLVNTQPTTPTNPTTPETENPSEPVVTEEGDIIVTRSSEHTGTLELGSSDDIYAVSIKADGAPMTIERVDFLFDKRPWRYIDSFELYHNDKKIASQKATESNLTSVGNEYRLRFSGLNSLVKKSDKDTFVLKAKALGNISSSREQDTMSVYIPSRGIRAIDTAKITSYGPNNNLDVRTFDFYDAEHDGELVVTLGTNSPQSGIIAVQANSNTTNKPVMIASIKAKKSDMELSDLYVKVASSEATVSNVVRKLALVVDGTTVASETVIKNGSVAITGIDEDGNTYTIIDANEYYVRFTDLKNVTIEEDDRIDMTVTAEFYKQSGRYANGTDVTVTLRALTGENSHGEDIVNGNLTTGDNRTFTLYTEGLTFDFTSEKTGTRGQTDQTGTFTLTFDVTAFGNDIFVPVGAGRQVSTSTIGSVGAEYSIVNGNGERYALGAANQAMTIKNAKQEGSFFRINEGTTATVTLNITLNNEGATKDFYRTMLEAFRYRTGSTTGTEFTLTTGFSDFETEYVSINS